MKVRREISDSADDPSLDYAKARLNDALSKYERLMGRIETAIIELDTARATFRQRYSLISAAQLPTHSAMPNAFKILTAGLIAALFLAIFVPVAADIRAGRIVERWQVEHYLGLRILAQIRRR